MRFEYEGKIYDIRFKRRYLPKPLKDLAMEDLIDLMSSRVEREYKQTFMDVHLPGAKVL